MNNFDLDIPIPKRGADRFSLADFPKGGSKFFALDNRRAAALGSTLITRAKRLNVNGAKFVTRTRTEGDVIGIRIWRAE